MMIHDCIACQGGLHGQHIGTPGPVPDDMIGGWECHCTGDCAERYAKQVAGRRGSITDTTDYAAIEALLGPLAKGPGGGS